MTDLSEKARESTSLTDTGLDIVPVAGYIGAEVRGVDLRGELEAGVVEEIRNALHTYKVIFFRDQEIGHAEQIAFARNFGKVTPAHPHEEEPPDSIPTSSQGSCLTASPTCCVATSPNARSLGRNRHDPRQFGVRS
ncbi:TauD/TfdA dioxygenase family protein, partial [Mycolicibacterium porcinum]|uniref:TauD/TfdA dioxygenase family protein n=1 Tax=Mycolicibacterium porcinum TaxID=39693 RepID=UPI000ADA2269